MPLTDRSAARAEGTAAAAAGGCGRSCRSSERPSARRVVATPRRATAAAERAPASTDSVPDDNGFVVGGGGVGPAAKRLSQPPRPRAEQTHERHGMPPEPRRRRPVSSRSTSLDDSAAMLCTAVHCDIYMQRSATYNAAGHFLHCKQRKQRCCLLQLHAGHYCCERRIISCTVG